MKSELVKPGHLAKKAVVYIRQSTPHQAVSNQESLRLQYALRQRARELGWHEADIDIIDADLGLSGASTAQRGGFKELVGRVGLNEVGLILSIDVTRLARNCSDWYPLLDICGLRDCLIADRDGVYDPGSPNGRLLLGLKGTISELELHTIRSRLTAGLVAKAERGELALMLPVGLVRDPTGVVMKDPNIEVQERLALVFQTFLKVRTVAKTVRTFIGRSLDLPRRDRYGDAHWVRPTVSAMASVLKNPAYAGAFVYGRTSMSRGSSDGTKFAKKPRPLDAWRIVVKDRYPAYIDWPTYEKIREIISDNRAEYMRTKTRGAPRDGDLLLHGIVWCARCGHKMYVRYKGGGEYVCNHLRSQHQGLSACQYLRAPLIDAAVSEAFLSALGPAELDALSRARHAQQQTDAALRKNAEQQLERKRYAAALAERQFNRVDPDNRLVAGELERRWEAALNEVREAEQAMARQSAPRSAGPVIDKALNDKVVLLTGRLPQIWADHGTTDAQRKALLRCLVEKVVLDRGEHDVALARIVWRGGATSELSVRMHVNSVVALERGAEMITRILDLAQAGKPDGEIAAILTASGHRSPNCADRVLPITVQRIRLGAGIKVTDARNRWTHDADVLSAQEIAGKLNIPVNWLYVQIKQGRLVIDRQPTGAYLFENTPSVVQAVQDLRNHRVRHLDLRISQPQQEGHQHA